MVVLESIQGSLGYEFKEPSLLYEAITHRSYSQSKTDMAAPHNERLEFLGDAVLGLVVSESVAMIFPNVTEGKLSKIKATLISRLTLAMAAKRIELGQWLLLGRGEEMTHGREKASLLANALEAVIAAIYLDGGLHVARTFIHKVLAKEFSELKKPSHPLRAWDCKSQLQEWTHKHVNADPEYRLVCESGPDHQKIFEVTVHIQGKMVGRGEGRTKKEAEQRAAQQAIDRTGN